METITITLVRHSITAGNLAHQYIGRTDQPLCPEGIALAERFREKMPRIERLYVSPMQRCRETAAILFPGHVGRIVEGLREADFGSCEGRTYQELRDDPAYCEWISSQGRLPPPGGEGSDAFRARCVAAWQSMVAALFDDGIRQAAVVLHGGSIMTTMDALCTPSRSFYDWQVQNCCGFTVAAAKNGSSTLLSELGSTIHQNPSQW